MIRLCGVIVPAKKQQQIKQTKSNPCVWRGIQFASKFEREFAKLLNRNNIKWEYEPDRIYWLPKPRTYVPDFKVYLKDGTPVYLETKGFFKQSDRSKMATIKEQHPDLDIRMVFMEPKKVLSKKTKKASTYAAWAEKKGFDWSTICMPSEWRKSFMKKNAKVEDTNNGC